MNNLVYQQIGELLADSAQRKKSSYEKALRVGAATLWSNPAGDVTAATVVCELPADDVDLFEAVIADIAHEHQLEARVRRNSGSFSVRFTRSGAVPRQFERKPETSLRMLLGRVFGPPRTLA